MKYIPEYSKKILYFLCFLWDDFFLFFGFFENFSIFMKFYNNQCQSCQGTTIIVYGILLQHRLRSEEELQQHFGEHSSKYGTESKLPCALFRSPRPSCTKSQYKKDIALHKNQQDLSDPWRIFILFLFFVNFVVLKVLGKFFQVFGNFFFFFTPNNKPFFIFKKNCCHKVKILNT